VLKGVAQVDGFLNCGVALISELAVFMLQVCDQ
jgi:hypothetical protein